MTTGRINQVTLLSVMTTVSKPHLKGETSQADTTTHTLTAEAAGV